MHVHICTHSKGGGEKEEKREKEQKIHGTNTKHQDQRPNNKYAIIILSVNVL